MIEALQDFVSDFPTWMQWVGVMLVSAIPFVESYFGSLIGVVIGLPPVVAVAAAVIGNVISMLAFVMSAHGVRTRVVAGRSGGVAVDDREPEETPRRQKLRRAFDRYGVAGVSLLGQTILPSQITSAAMVSFGANRNLVIFWQTISIILWGVVFAILATLGVNLTR
ncbi:putative membrane protein [Microbacterium terrae]|uniref:Small multidrug efflux protein n=1 Tax=Microbacterium terrae TaxID=69369 RepID=A0A0M2H4H6_9MICO|nr:hypothetical protein [Microbacterium terrae]KJL39356.1 hypothetical protein RS81_01986 [Microbacterium terrae]MBP1078356.1 putative membrane protein [Microbacterium terrae]GLJ97836.1 hypothetical protein GCM10017594_10330 [Microbacterium terrae]